MKDGYTNVYNQHLDVCSWCSDHPFDLCTVGTKVLKEAALKALDEMAVHNPFDDDGFRDPWPSYEDPDQ